jgi:hypothetical protein
MPHAFWKGYLRDLRLSSSPPPRGARAPKSRGPAAEVHLTMAWRSARCCSHFGQQWGPRDVIGIDGAP